MSDFAPPGVTQRCDCNGQNAACSCDCHQPGNDWCWAMVGRCVSAEVELYREAQEVLRLRRLATS